MKRRTGLVAVLLLGACSRSETGEPTALRQAANAVEQAAKPSQMSEAREPKVGPCLMQDGEPLQVRPVKAIGTEPFWGARAEGRCVTYSTPEDQKGTRVWTRVETGPQGPVWTGAVRGRQFQLYVKPSTGCSDGMSDRSYPLEALVRVDGETRRGCAEPL